MDSQTVKVYDQIAQQWFEKYNSLRSKTLLDLALQHFAPAKRTLEVGTGSGQDLNFLNQQGFPTTGLDASEGLLEECQKRFPQYSYVLDNLPLLKEIPSESFYHVYSSAVIMHLPEKEIPLALENISRVLRPKGVLVLSYRHSLSSTLREEDGRLFTFIDPQNFQDLLKEKGFELLFYEGEKDPGGMKIWHHFAARKKGLGQLDS